MSPTDAPALAPANTHQTQAVHFPFDNSYARLPERFYARVAPTPVASPRLILVNSNLAEALGLDPQALATPEGVAILAGSQIAQGSQPLAEAYAGHQFGHFVPQLGDGRANLLGELIARDGLRYDIQLKGSGPTPFSRRGDGRAALGPVLREYLVSEAMAALNVPTSRALAAVTTGERVFRETAVPGAVLTRVAASHLRVGTFQYFAARGDAEAVRLLADHAIARHYPNILSNPDQSAKPYRAFLEAVIARHAALVAQWMLLGFIHGVMNTDNTSISGETLDYGPCAFLEAYDPEKVFSSIDQQGRYSYRNQPNAAHWNLARLAETLLPLLVQEEGSDQAGLDAAHEALATFAPQAEAARVSGLRRKLGLLADRPEDSALAEDLLDRMAANHADFTLTFHRLIAAAANPGGANQDRSVAQLFADPEAFFVWATTWHQRLQAENTPPDLREQTMRLANPHIIPRNHLVQAVIDAAVDQQDFQPFEQLLDASTHPFNTHPGSDRYAQPALPHQCVTATFCGT